jgi:hypothetical protein
MKEFAARLLFIMLVPVSATHAGMFKCVSPGLTIYQEQPCKPGATATTPGPELRQQRSDDEVVAEIKRRIAKRDEEERIAEEYRAFMQSRKRKEARCSLLLQTAARSKNEADLWDNQALVADARMRKRAAEDAFIKECPGVIH